MHSKIIALFDTGVSTRFEKGEVVFGGGEPTTSMFLVEDGCVELVRHTLSGNRLILSRVLPGHVLAEASAYSDTYHCDGVSLNRSRVKRIPIAQFRQNLSANTDLQHIWASGLAHELQAARMAAEIRTLRTVSERLEVWLESNERLPPVGERQMLAQVLGVTREALYRELAKRKT